MPNEISQRLIRFIRPCLKESWFDGFASVDAPESAESPTTGEEEQIILTDQQSVYPAVVLVEIALEGAASNNFDMIIGGPGVGFPGEDGEQLIGWIRLGINVALPNEVLSTPCYLADGIAHARFRNWDPDYPLGQDVFVRMVFASQIP